MGGFGAIQALSSVAVVFDGVDYQAFWIERVESGVWVVAARSVDEDGRLGPRYAVMAPEIDDARPRLFARVVGPGRVIVAAPTVEGGVAVDWIADGATEGGYRVLTTIDSDCDPVDRVLGAEIQPGPAGPQLHVLFCGSSTVPAFAFQLDAIDPFAATTRRDLPIRVSRVLGAAPDHLVVQTGVVAAGLDDTPTAAALYPDNTVVGDFVVPHDPITDRTNPAWL